MLLSHEHQQHGHANKKNTGKNFFSVDVPGWLFHLTICHRGNSAAEPQPKANLKHTETQARGQEIRWQNKVRVLSADGV
jgi:hypothetical protein